VTNPTISTTNNRLSSAGYAYDTSGNLTADPGGHTYVYDAENKQIEVKNSSSVPLGQYFYDGDGKRVKKVVPNGETTIFVYDSSGKMVAEYSTLLNPTPQVSYLTTDHLGSPRINTNENGAVISRHDYHPFGEEITSSQRALGIGYAADNVRKQFTGYERDNESDLDFAQARMYVSRLGRFTTPDPIKMSDDRLIDPQTINLYAYTRNNPLSIIDPSGMDLLRLGRTDAQVLDDITAQQALLNGNISDATRDKIYARINALQTEILANLVVAAWLYARINALQTEILANLVVAAWLAAGNTVGELKNVKLSDLYISTSASVDFVKADMDYLKKNNPKATKKEIEAYRKKSQARADSLVGGATESFAVTTGGKIYILTEASSFLGAATSGL
jgi:RHS repeat-associated protein